MGETGLNFRTSRAKGRGLRSPSFIGMSKDSNFCQPPSLSSRRKSFKSPVLELKFSLAYLLVAALAPSHRVVEPGEAFSPRGTAAAAPNKTQVFAGPILVPPLGQRGGSSVLPHSARTQLQPESNTFCNSSLSSHFYFHHCHHPKLPIPIFLPSLHSPSFLFLLRSESLLAESAVLPFPLRSWSG